MQNVTGGTIARTVCLLVALVNQTLTVLGKAPLQIEDETITLLISSGVTAVTAIVVWWKNNSFTQAAIEADKAFKE